MYVLLSSLGLGPPGLLELLNFHVSEAPCLVMMMCMILHTLLRWERQGRMLRCDPPVGKQDRQALGHPVSSCYHEATLKRPMMGMQHLFKERQMAPMRGPYFQNLIDFPHFCGKLCLHVFMVNFKVGISGSRSLFSHDFLDHSMLFLYSESMFKAAASCSGS